MNELNRGVIRTLKGLETGGSATGFDTGIPVITAHDVKIGSLKPINRQLAGDAEIISSLTNWRQRFKRFFFTQFEATDERTRSWLNDVVIKDDTRILFLIMNAENRPTGHVGACNITGDSAELDNFIRGERGGDPKLMLLSGLSLIGWLYGALNIRQISARVIANNVRTLSVYREAGCFERSEPQEFVKDKGGNGRDDDGDDRPGDHAPHEAAGYVKMTLDMQKFLSAYPWMVRPAEDHHR